MISKPDYSCDFFIYVAASMETIGMVLVQEDEDIHEHVILLKLILPHMVNHTFMAFLVPLQTP